MTDFVTIGNTITASYKHGKNIDISLHDGSILSLQKISKNYNPENKIEAIKKIQQSEQQGKVLTGLLYINPKAKDLKEILHVVDTPLNKLVERDLCPGKEKINQINSSLK